MGNKLIGLTIRCPVCSRVVELRTTRKEGVVWGMCPFDWFRGFFSQKSIEEKAKKKGIREEEIMNEEKILIMRKSSDGYYQCSGCYKKYTKKGYLINHLEKVIIEKEIHPRIYNQHKKAGLI